ncbi:ATP synthase protein I [Pacificibacter maritimus]|uniref:ATP synthase protein I n=1 Tax=Pacificibacter maritimus TaxID=762213 RepID=A0A3N4V2P2_9RHOB|nr:AtpZ/AtpI family protein [Pacificibacter maritimus]RPE67204.1 ATP synthase protein I [Pacificibacter maritimus]
MTDPHDPKRLEALDARLEALKQAQAPKSSRGEEHFSQANMAWRMVIELVAGLLIGFGMGWGLDKLFGTTPIFIVLMVGFGLAAGVKTMMRTAATIQAEQEAEASKLNAQATAVDDNAAKAADDERD